MMSELYEKLSIHSSSSSLNLFIFLPDFTEFFDMSSNHLGLLSRTGREWPFCEHFGSKCFVENVGEVVGVIS